jgi:hypothetical protein
MVHPLEGRLHDVYSTLFPDSLLVLTGLGPLAPDLDSAEGARQVEMFLDGIRGNPRIGAAFVGSTTPGTPGEPLAWTTPEGEVSELARVLGKRER